MRKKLGANPLGNRMLQRDAEYLIAHCQVCQLTRRGSQNAPKQARAVYILATFACEKKSKNLC